MDSSSLKPGWTRVAFGEIAACINDRIDNPAEAGVERYVGLEHLDPDSLTIRRWGTPTDVAATKLRFKHGDIVFGRRRAYQRKLAVATFDGICSAHAMVLRASPAFLEPRFLPFFMQSQLFMDRAKAISVGSLSPTINWETLSKQEFTIPPLAEQQRITRVLYAIDRYVEGLMTLAEKLKAVEDCTFNALVSCSSSQDVILGSLLTELPRNGCSAVESSCRTGHWVLALSALTKSGYRRGQVKPVQATPAMLKAVLGSGDLLVSRSNTRDLVGLAGTFDENRCDVSWPDTMMRLRPNKSAVRSRFLELFLRSATGRRQIQSFAAGTSASMKKINRNSILKIVIAVPPLQTQDAIIGNMETVRLARQSVERRRSELIGWRICLLDGMLFRRNNDH